MSSSFLFRSYNIKICYEEGVKPNHKERSGKQHFKFVVNLVDCSELGECLMVERKHFILFIECLYVFPSYLLALVWLNHLISSCCKMLIRVNVLLFLNCCGAIYNPLYVIHI